MARGSADGPRQRAARALAANPDKSLTVVAEIAGVSRGTVVAAHAELAKEQRRAARKRTCQPRETMPSTPIGGTKPANPPDRRERAQRFLKDALAGGPKPVSAVEQAASKAHVDTTALDQARADLHVVTSRGNTGGVQAVQWSLPG